MRLTLSKLLPLAVAATLLSAQAQTLTYSWTYEGGGLDPATYALPGPPVNPGYKPSTLVPDDSATGASISVTGYDYGMSGGLGSSGYPEGYGFFYTVLQAEINLTINVTNVLDDIGTVTLSFRGNDLSTPWSQSILSLNYNPENTAVMALDYFTAPAGEDPEWGPLTAYTWIWDVSGLGASGGFSITVNAASLAQHTTIGPINLTQTAVPEPSVFGLLALGVGGLWLLRSRRNRQCA